MQPSFKKITKKKTTFVYDEVSSLLPDSYCLFLFLPWNGSEFFKENKSLRRNMWFPAGVTCMTDVDQTGVPEHLAPAWEKNEILTDNFTAACLSRLFPVKATNRWCWWCLLALGSKVIFVWPSLSVQILLSASCSEAPTGCVLCRTHHYQQKTQKNLNHLFASFTQFASHKVHAKTLTDVTMGNWNSSKWATIAPAVGSTLFDCEKSNKALGLYWTKKMLTSCWIIKDVLWLIK